LAEDGDIEEGIGATGVIIGCICRKREGKNLEQNGNKGADLHKIVNYLPCIKKPLELSNGLMYKLR